nr:hypothetical protein [uncultured Mucilaginibacter sp.]
MTNLILLTLLLLTITLSLGGGLYETLVIYPNWKKDVHPSTLLEKLHSSGQMLAGNRFWPLVSPAQVLLSIANMVMAYLHDGPAREVWLTAAIIIFVSRVITFSYFIPVMLRYIMKSEHVEPNRLRTIVKWWVGLSPLRLLPEAAAWGLCIYALAKMI